MGRAIEETIYGGAISAHNAQLVVELVGPAGAGKTSLVTALVQRDQQIQAGIPPYFRRTEDIPFFARNSLLFLPTLIHLLSESRGKQPSLREVAWMVTLQGWHHCFRFPPSHGRRVIILDQGPLFMLADLASLVPQETTDRSLTKWWNTIIKQWAGTLDMVIWLDSADRILMDRIRSRDKWHVMKDGTDPELSKFLGDSRESYRKVLGMLLAYRADLKLFRFDTGEESLEGIVKKLLEGFGFDEYGIKFIPDGLAKPAYSK